MKKSVIRRKNYLRNQIFKETTRTLCRNHMSTSSFTRNRKITFSDILLMTLNKQGRNTSFEIRDYEINKKGGQFVGYSDEAYLKQRRILTKKFNAENFKEIYHARWKIEEGYNSLKNKLKIEKFTGKLPIFIYQDMTKFVSVVRKNRNSTERRFIYSNKYHSNRGASF